MTRNNTFSSIIHDNMYKMIRNELDTKLSRVWQKKKNYLAVLSKKKHKKIQTMVLWRTDNNIPAKLSFCVMMNDGFILSFATHILFLIKRYKFNKFVTNHWNVSKIF